MLTGVETLRSRVGPGLFERLDPRTLDELLRGKSASYVEDYCFTQLLEWTGLPLTLHAPKARVAEYMDGPFLVMKVICLELLRENWRSHSPSGHRAECAQLIVDLLTLATVKRRARWRTAEDPMFASFLAVSLEWLPYVAEMPRIPFPPFLDIVTEHLPDHFIRSSELFAELQGYEPSSVARLLRDLRRHFQVPPRQG